MPPRPETATLKVKVSPRSSRNSLKVEPDGSLKVWVTAPPVEGEANQAVCDFIAKKLKLAKSRVTVHSGEASRDKTIHVKGISSDKALLILRNIP